MPDTPAAAETAPMTVDPVKRFLLRHPAIAVTLAYLLLTTIGVTFSYMHYRMFGIAIFDYWQPSDLVLAGFREPASFLYAAAAVALGVYDYRWQADRPRILAEQRARLTANPHDGLRGWLRKLQLRIVQEQIDLRSGKAVPFRSGLLAKLGRWVRANRVTMQVVTVLIVYSSVVFVHTGERYQRLDAWFPAIQVTVAAPGPTVVGDPTVGKQMLIGASNSYLFVADALSHEVTVIPVNSVVSFKVERSSLREAFGR